MRQFLIYYDIIRKAHIVRCKGTFHVFACAKFDICTVYESITVHLHVNYLAITVRQRIRYGIHPSQSREETGSCQTDQGIVINLMSGIDHANTACVTESVANKQVVINRVTVTVSQCYYSFAFQQDIVPNHIIAGFYRDYFHFTGTALEQVIFNYCVRGTVCLLGSSHTHGFRTVRAVHRPLSEIIMVYLMMIFQTTLIVEDDNQCHPQIKFSCQ